MALYRDDILAVYWTSYGTFLKIYSIHILYVLDFVYSGPICGDTRIGHSMVGHGSFGSHCSVLKQNV